MCICSCLFFVRMRISVVVDGSVSSTSFSRTFVTPSDWVLSGDFRISPTENSVGFCVDNDVCSCVSLAVVMTLSVFIVVCVCNYIFMHVW